MKKVYIVEMLRWGNPERHHYLLGAYSTREAAELAGNVEVSWRACKYQPSITELVIDAPLSDEQLSHHRECTYDTDITNTSAD